MIRADFYQPYFVKEKMARMIKLSTPSGTKTSDDADGAKKEEIENDSTENKDIKPSR